MVPKDALSARGPGDARGFDPGGPGTWNSPMENPPTMSAVDEKPAMQEFSNETRRGVKNGAIENPEVPHGNSGTSDNLEDVEVILELSKTKQTSEDQSEEEISDESRRGAIKNGSER